MRGRGHRRGCIIYGEGEGKVERAKACAKARVSARARSAASTRRTACKHAAELRASTQRTRAARRALQARDELRASTQRESRLPRKLFTSANVSFGDKILRALRSRCESDLSRTHISSTKTPPCGKYETIISKIFLKGYCLSERCATYVVFRLVFLRGLYSAVCSIQSLRSPPHSPHTRTPFRESSRLPTSLARLRVARLGEEHRHDPRRHALVQRRDPLLVLLAEHLAHGPRLVLLLELLGPQRARDEAA